MNIDRSWLTKHSYSQRKSAPRVEDGARIRDVENGHEPKFLYRAERWEKKAAKMLTGAEISQYRVVSNAVLFVDVNTREAFRVDFDEWIELTQTLSRKRC